MAIKTSEPDVTSSAFSLLPMYVKILDFFRRFRKIQ